MDTYSMKCVAPTVAAILGLEPPAAATESAIAAVVRDLGGAQHVAVLAPDAFGIVPWQRWQDEMPFLKSLHARHSILLESIMPSSTPMNFACMVTGAELAVHGMRTREMDFQCETLFDVVRRAGGQSAGVGHRGYSGELLLARCADIPGVTEPGLSKTITRKIMEICTPSPPSFLIAQFGDVDTLFHQIGPSHPDVVPMLRELDEALSQLVPFLTARGMAVILLADHGQHDVPPTADKPGFGTHGTDCPEDRLVPCTWTR